MRRARGLFAAVLCVGATAAPAAAAGPPLANRCLAVGSIAADRFVQADGAGYRATADGRDAARFFLEPTGLGTYMLYDAQRMLVSADDGGPVGRSAAPGPAAEWAPTRAGADSRIRSTDSGRVLAVEAGSRRLVTAPPATAGRAARFRLVRTSGCTRYPDATISAMGSTFRGRLRDGSVLGYADPHLHVTADLRAGGRVIHGAAFHRFGITRALGGDEANHGPNGSIDVTGNLLRSGSPVGTHDTEGWPSFAGWPTYDTYTHQQTYYRWLQRAWMGGLRLIVAQIVEDEPLCNLEPLKAHSCDEQATIELGVKRLRALQDYVDAQRGGRGRGWFRLVYGPRAARRAIEQGKLAVIIGAETSNPFGCSEVRGQPQCDRADIDAGIARLRKIGVRTLFPAHWVNNALSGAALEGGDKGAFIGVFNVEQTGDFFETGPCPHPGQGEEVQPAGPELLTLLLDEAPATVPVYPPGKQCNVRGLTQLGEYAIRRLMDNHMLIEVDHMSEWARQRVLRIAERRGYPLVSSHTGTGGPWHASELRRLFAVGGFASANLDAAARLPEKILAFRAHTSRRPLAVGMGTDTGGFAALPGPAASAAKDPLRYPFRAARGKVRFGRERTGTRTFDLNRDGVAHYGLMPDLLADVRRQARGDAALRQLFGSAEAYLRTWRRAMRD